MTTTPIPWTVPLNQVAEAARNAREEAIKTGLDAYIKRLADSGVSGWVFSLAKDLHAECGRPATLQQFARYLKKQETPKRHTDRGTQYAFYIA
jgi:hypothetical protein